MDRMKPGYQRGEVKGGEGGEGRREKRREGRGGDGRGEREGRGGEGRGGEGRGNINILCSYNQLHCSFLKE